MYNSRDTEALKNILHTLIVVSGGVAIVGMIIYLFFVL